jgi:Zinc carboxypeptidase
MGRNKRRVGVIFLVSLFATAPLVMNPDFLGGRKAMAAPNPVATTDEMYDNFGRVFPDPHGCLAFGVPDANGDGVKDTPRGVSPWAKGRMCAAQFLHYDEVIAGANFLSQRFPDLIDIVRLDEEYDNPDFKSAGLPRAGLVRNEETGEVDVKILGRDRRPLYMFKVTNEASSIPEADRKHFTFTLSIHGIERAGVEGGTRAMEDLITWAACEKAAYVATTPACAVEGPFPKKIVESNSPRAVPTAGEVLDRSVIYFVLPNPDGWARGQVSPVEVEDGTPNPNYAPGFFFQRYNGNGVDLNRDWPTKGYTYKPYSPGSEPETKAYAHALQDVMGKTAAGRFDGGIDLHGMITAHAFSYTLLGSGQRDYRKNAITVETSIRTWEDQTKRLAWSPYVADADADGVADGAAAAEHCMEDTVIRTGQSPTDGTRGKLPACVADEWGTVIDTLGYQVTGAAGDWIDSSIGLDAVGIDNEMYASHLAPNTVFEPAMEQTHIDGNKGLIYSLIASLLREQPIAYDPPGRIAYVQNPLRLQRGASTRPSNPTNLPPQQGYDVLLPCGVDAAGTNGGCQGGTYTPGASQLFEFTVKGPDEGVFNGGITVEITKPNAAGVGSGNAQRSQLQYFTEGQWQPIAQDISTGAGYQQAGAIITANDPMPGRWRVAGIELAGSRVQITFNEADAEASPGQAAINASSMDFFTDLNKYVPAGEKLQALTVRQVLDDSLDTFDTVVLVNNMGDRNYLTSKLGVSIPDAARYMTKLKAFVTNGGNLVLTDAALRTLTEFGLTSASQVRRLQATSTADDEFVGFYNFRTSTVATAVPTYENPEQFPLARDVKKPGTAEQILGKRQAVEPTPLGYTPDHGMDLDPRMPYFGVDNTRWNAICGLPNCVTARARPGATTDVNLGELALGAGRIRIVGVMFPDPIFQPDGGMGGNDHRFGLSSYALTYTAYEVFENLMDWQNPARVDPHSGVDLGCGACTLSAPRGSASTAPLTVTNTGTWSDSFEVRVKSALAGWAVSLSPRVVSAASGASGSSTLSVTPPAGAAPGVYEVVVEAISNKDWNGRDEVTITVTVI